MKQELVCLTTDSLYFHRTVSDTPNEEYALHCHPYYEVFYFLRGEVSYRIEGAEYPLQPGSLLLMRPGVFHGVRILTDRPYERVAVHFLPGYLSSAAAELLLSPFQTRGCCLLGGDDYRIADYLASILCCADMPEALQSIALRPRVEALMAQVCLMAQCLPAGEPVEPVKPSILQIIDYINAHVREPISLDELSSRFFISKNQLNRVFRQATGTTVINYVTHKRIALAQQLLLSGMSAAEASLRSGFGDYSNFYRTYRRLSGHSPTEAQRTAVL